MDSNRPAPKTAKTPPPRAEALTAVARLSNVQPDDVMDYLLITINHNSEVVLTGSLSTGRTAAILHNVLQIVMHHIVNGETL